MIVALAGGVGGARLAVGLAAALPPRALTIVVNTGDDFEHLGLAISPDLDTVMYKLAGIENAQTGWGRAGETWNCMDALAQLGGETWFRLGDKDLAVHLLRTQALRQGKPLSEITRMLATQLGIKHEIVPMSDSPVHTQVRTASGVLSFQDYFVRRQCRPRVRGFRFAGARTAQVPPLLQKIIGSGKVKSVLICPSNPYVSVAPILSVPAIRAWIDARDFPVVAVSPIVGNVALKGPAAKMMRELGSEASALGIARHYGGRVDGWVIDRQDARLAHAIENTGRSVLVTDTVMSNRARSTRLAKKVVDFAQALARRSK